VEVVPLPPPTGTPTPPLQILEPSSTAASVNEIPIIERVSIASDGTQGNSDSFAPNISADGRYVTFCSDASNLIAGDTNGFADIFVHDRKTGETTRVSVSSDGMQGNNGAGPGSSISADGRFVAFSSDATNLVEGDTNGVRDCFVHDRMTGETTRVSIASDGTQANRDCVMIHWWGIFSGLYISADGRYVRFRSYATNLVEGITNGDENNFVHDRVTGETILEYVFNNETQKKSDLVTSADGRYEMFYSDASNLVEGDTNGVIDVFVRDLGTSK
jgi:Tol biopolymer transport system component